MPGQSQLRQQAFAHPKYWLIWLGLGLAWLIVRSPLFVRNGTGSLIGILGYHLAKSRRHIVEVNLRLCFPRLDASAHQKMTRAVFRSLGLSMVETATAWLLPADQFVDRVNIHGLDELKLAADRGNGVILMGMHFATLDICGAMLGHHVAFDIMYRRNKNPLLEAVMTRGRERHYPRAIERSNVRAVISNLRKGHIVWYGPDQDYGRKHSVIADFFGIKTASVTATARIARMTGAAIVAYSHYRRPDGRYDIYLEEVLTEGYPSDDPVKDAHRVNIIVESAIQHAPDQYWWLHRRFKTRPEGEVRPY